jgi:hypothetical protein
MNTTIRSVRSWALVMLMLSAARPALAQNDRTAVGVAYQLVDSPDMLFPIGLNVDLTAGISRGFDVVGEAGWSRHSSQQFGLRDVTMGFDAAGGIRWRTRLRRLAPFAQMLVGLERERTDVERFGADWTSSLLLQPGAGLAVRIATREALFGQIDLRHRRQHPDATNAVRVLIGVRFDLH